MWKYKNKKKNSEILHDLCNSVIPHTQYVITLDCGTVSNQKDSTFFFCHEDICGLLTWHGAKIPAEKKEEKKCSENYNQKN